ncbi:probable glucosamine 6-phosphate N-acetyltransferase isoform X1 [Drosophila subpulchrella]|uniref:probable glucosamine 6-phosphate N-acetyltransferase isoform X1 n=1 Tax=Drosophila subpulchrella TaxID=1486046 RepID=UPI0018A1A3AD|nr:probable glucosamine 6-phosphate N-acetyltransferase isoform X1 [Drosophila subpulchrella]
MVQLTEETYLYDPNLLLKLDFHRSPAKFNPFISAANPGEPWMKVRPLKDTDYDRGFLQLLSQLTHVGNVNRTQFLTRFSQMKASGDYFVTVIEDTRKNEIIGAASLVIERKFIHNCAVRGRLEDVVVNDTYRGKQLGKLIVVTVSLLAEELGCYKMSLDCKDKLIKFYESLGYVAIPGNSNSMTIRYDEGPALKRNSTSAGSSGTVGDSCQTNSQFYNFFSPFCY